MKCCFSSGDLDFVEYPIEGGKSGPVAAKRDSSPSGDSASSGSPERKVCRRPPSVSPQRLDSVASLTSEDVNAPPKKGKSRLLTMVSDLDAEMPIPGPSSERVERSLPGPSSAISGSLTKVPLVVLERCGETTPKCPMPNKSPSEHNASKSTIFSVSTMMFGEPECFCDELTDETDPWEVVPCGIYCRHPILTETTTPRRRAGEEAREGRRESQERSGESRRRSESPEEVLDHSLEGSSHCRMNATCPGSTEKHSPPSISSTLAARHNESASTNSDGGRRLPAWLRERPRSLSKPPDLPDSGPYEEESAHVNSEPPDEDSMCDINPEQRACEFWYDERYIIDPLYADLINRPRPFIVKDGVEYNWGPLLFPVAHLHTINP